MTLMLDGAKFTRDVPLGSPTLYAAEFAKQDGSRCLSSGPFVGNVP